jgi:hypothetical protein
LFLIVVPLERARASCCVDNLTLNSTSARRTARGLTAIARMLARRKIAQISPSNSWRQLIASGFSSTEMNGALLSLVNAPFASHCSKKHLALARGLAHGLGCKARPMLSGFQKALFQKGFVVSDAKPSSAWRGRDILWDRPARLPSSHPRQSIPIVEFLVKAGAA